MAINARKIGIIGCGLVGSASAFALMQSGLFTEMVLIDAKCDKAEGEALDLSHGTPFGAPVQIYAGTYRDVADAALLIIAAGANQRPGETRLDLAHKNSKVLWQVVEEIRQQPFEGILLVVTNPVDILTYEALSSSGYSPNRVIGSGTVLDTARLKTELSRSLGVDSRSVHAFIIGEHGDSEIAAWSCANVSGIPLSDFCRLREVVLPAPFTDEIAQAVQRSAYDIIAKKGATCYGIAMAVRRICEAIVRDEKSVLPISTLMEGEYGIRGVALSMPCIVGKQGCEAKVPLALNALEAEALHASARAVKQAFALPVS